MSRLGTLCCIALGAVAFLAVRVQAQVDWSEVLSGKVAEPTAQVPQHHAAPTPPAQSAAQGRQHRATRVPSRRLNREAPTRHSRQQAARPEPQDEPEYPPVSGKRPR
jgi:hypothetical protein